MGLSFHSLNVSIMATAKRRYIKAVSVACSSKSEIHNENSR